MMTIKIGNIEVDAWEGGYPVWIHIRNGQNEVSFTHVQLQSVIDALEAMKRLAYGQLPEQYRHEVKL